MWWRDLGRLEGEDSNREGWLSNSIIKKIGNGSETSFWNECWIVQQPLSCRFPRLYNISSQKNVVVAKLGNWNNGRWSWFFKWRRGLFVWEENLVNSLLELLYKCGGENEDCWVWRGGLIDITLSSRHTLL